MAIDVETSIAIFLDDGQWGGIDQVSAKPHYFTVQSSFAPNQEKSLCGEPVQNITWLGVLLNTIDGSVKATDERIAKLTSDLVSLQALISELPLCNVHVKRVASVAGN